MSLAVDVVAWNLNNGDRPTFPNELASLPAAVAYAFSETGGHLRDLDAWSRGRFRVVTVVGDVGSNVQLFLDVLRVKVLRWGVEIVDVPWRGPKGKRIAGRSIVWALVEIDGVPLLLVAVHGPWNPVRNFRAWRAYQRKLRQIGTWFPYADMLLVGDQNQSWAKRTAWAIRGTANRIGARLVSTGLSVDFGLHRPGRFKRWTVTARRGTKMLSDHRYVRYRLVAR